MFKILWAFDAISQSFASMTPANTNLPEVFGLVNRNFNADGTAGLAAIHTGKKCTSE